MSNNLIVPPGFSKGFQKRIENAMIQKAHQNPGLPPQLSVQINSAIATAVAEGKFTQLQIGVGALGQTKVIKIMVFRDEFAENSLPKVDLNPTPEPINEEKGGEVGAEGL